MNSFFERDTGIEIRDVTASDEDVVYRFMCELSGKALSRTGFSTALTQNLSNENNRYLLAEVGGEAVGMGSCHVQWLLHHAAPIAEVQELYVVPGFRSKGVGALLLSKLEEFARSRQADQIELSTNRVRRDAQRFYAREGYRDSHLKWVKEFFFVGK
jgi:PhnO protein